MDWGSQKLTWISWAHIPIFLRNYHQFLFVHKVVWGFVFEINYFIGCWSTWLWTGKHEGYNFAEWVNEIVNVANFSATFVRIFEDYFHQLRIYAFYCRFIQISISFKSELWDSAHCVSNERKVFVDFLGFRWRIVTFLERQQFEVSVLILDQRKLPLDSIFLKFYIPDLFFQLQLFKTEMFNFWNVFQLVLLVLRVEEKILDLVVKFLNFFRVQNSWLNVLAGCIYRLAVMIMGENNESVISSEWSFCNIADMSILLIFEKSKSFTTVASISLCHVQKPNFIPFVTNWTELTCLNIRRRHSISYVELIPVASKLLKSFRNVVPERVHLFEEDPCLPDFPDHKRSSLIWIYIVESKE